MEIKKTMGVLALALVAVLATAGISQLDSASAQQGQDQRPGQERQFDGPRGESQGEFRGERRGRQDGERRGKRRGPHGLPKEQAQQLRTAVQNQDFSTWSTIISENAKGDKAEKILEVVNADNFSQFAEMHELRKAGDHEAADELREELGLPERPEGKRGNGKFKPCEHDDHEEHPDHIEREEDEDDDEEEEV